MSSNNINISKAWLDAEGEIRILARGHELGISPHSYQLSKGIVLLVAPAYIPAFADCKVELDGHSIGGTDDPVLVEICRQFRELIDGGGEPQPDAEIQLDPVKVPARREARVHIPLSELMDYALGRKRPPPADAPAQ